MAGDSGIISDELRQELTDVEIDLARIDDLADSVSRTLSRAFRGALLDGKDLKSLMSDIGRSVADITLKAAFKPVGILASDLISNIFKATNPAVQAYAKGGVIASPSYFSMGNGLGLAGEAGPEAILPLQRGADGRLGVASAGGAPISISMNIRTDNAQSFVGAEAEVSAMLLRAVKRGQRGS